MNTRRTTRNSENVQNQPPQPNQQMTHSEMNTVKTPIFTPIEAPKITRTSHAALVQWRKLRQDYDARIAERINESKEDLATASRSVKSTFEPRLLALWCKHEWKIDINEVTDEFIREKINEIICSVKNQTVPDIEELFLKEIRMDLSESDVEERVRQYFVSCDELIDTEGLERYFKDKRGAKFKCKLITKSLNPTPLREAVEKGMKLESMDANHDELALYDLIMKKAIDQERQFQEQKKYKNKRLNQPIANPNKKLNKRVKVEETKPFEKIQQTKSAPKPPPSPCPKCKELHWLSDCPLATEEEKVNLRKKLREKRAQNFTKNAVRNKRIKECLADHNRTITLNGILTIPYCPDSGSTKTVISKKHWEELQKLDSTVRCDTFTQPTQSTVYGGRQVNCSQAVKLHIQIHTAAGPVELVHPTTCLIADVDDDEFILGDDVLKSIGIDVDRQIEQLAGTSQGVDSHDDPIDYSKHVFNWKENDETNLVLESLVAKAIEDGFPEQHKQHLYSIVHKFDIWRTELRNDPPARVPPLHIRIIHGKTPFKCKPRKYSPQVREFLKNFNEQLVSLGWVKENPYSRWASPALPVKKGITGSEMRQTVDYRAVNAITEVMAAAMPILSVVIEHIKGMKHFGSFDLLKGFWQLPLAEESQEILSYMTDDTIYTPCRVPQGCSDSAIYFQTTMETCFKELLYHHLLVWIDDILLYSDNIPTYLEKLEQFFSLLDKFGLKLNAKKSTLYKRSVKWCGKIISEDGITYDDGRLSALHTIPYPQTAGELQQFICAVNWIRDSLPDYARTSQPLQQRLDSALASTTRSKKIASKIPIVLSSDERYAFDAVKQLITQSATLSFPDDTQTTCLFTDASETGWAIVITQVANIDRQKNISEHQHSLLTCMSGTFSGSQVNWSIIEKEAFPIVVACDKLEYILLRTIPFHIYCDHRNLIHLFAPDQSIKKHVKGKLLRWSLKIMGYHYIIQHIEGAKNVWADMISRWATPREKLKTLRNNTVSTIPLRPLDDEGFIWPTLAEIAACQAKYSTPPSAASGDNNLLYIDSKIWIPPQEESLLLRLFIIAHCGSAGHRGHHVMHTHLSSLFSITNLSKSISLFIKDCLLCHHVKGGRMVKRPWSETIECNERNGVLHFDYLFMGESFGETKYLLVLKDHASHYCELIPCKQCDSISVVDALLSWNMRYGIPHTWVSDNGSHFKNEVVNELSKRMKTTHTFTMAYSPWINGTVERINRDILQVMRVMLLEYKLSYKDWPYLVPIVQANLNHSPVSSLKNKAPIELFTGLQCPTPFHGIYNKNENKFLYIPSTEKVGQFIENLRSSIQSMHNEIKDEKLKQKLLDKKRERSENIVNFDVGDYVLKSRIDEKRQNKLMVTWIGPYQVTKAEQHSFRIKHLITNEECDIHASRLKFFSDEKLMVNEELLEHISLQGIVLAVESLNDHRWNKNINDYEIKVSWKGLEEAEDSWEPLQSLSQDISILIDNYVNGNHADKQLVKYWNLHNQPNTNKTKRKQVPKQRTKRGSGGK